MRISYVGVAIVVVLVAWVVLSPMVSRVLGQAVVKDPTTAPAAKPEGAAATRPASVLDFTVKDIDGKEYPLGQLKGKVVLFVNVASKCGFTKQYKGLETIYQTYRDKGLVIVGFPANNFNGQEPGTEAEIKEFCSSKFNVTFPLMSKISVKGADQHPLYHFLTSGAAGEPFKGDVAWNFNKFLIDRNGNVYARFGSKTTPEDKQLVGAIEKGLSAPAAQ